VALQVGAVDLVGRFRGGVQVGVVNFVGTTSFARYVEEGGPERPPSFEGALQVGGLNMTSGTFAGGAQVGLLGNVNRSDFQGVVEAGLVGNYVDGNFEGVVQLGGANIVMGRFSGLLQVGGGNHAQRLHGVQLGLVNLGTREVRGAQLGALNVTRDLRGLQIGIVNKTTTLRGVQLGLVNLVERSVPVVPVLNLGW
jgi:hypothetical protein